MTCGTWVVPTGKALSQTILSGTESAGYEFPEVNMKVPGGVAGSGCPVKSYQVFNEDCSTISLDFENS